MVKGGGTIGPYHNWYGQKEKENPYKILADFENEKGNKVRLSKRFESMLEAVVFFENYKGFCLLTKSNVDFNNTKILKYKFR